MRQLEFILADVLVRPKRRNPSGGGETAARISFLSFFHFYAIIAVSIIEMSGEIKWKQVK
ncbi:hypothetical protein [Planococcus chinensis]|uniref:hypothetical protein n=1 Tax=Planococcus chinensis TaxID=272917 RepID=UPI001CC546FB|nr:hypothetical protein [Planococcus chinensis]